MISSRRRIISLMMTGLYLLITLSPLAPLAMHDKRIAHAVTGECAGDCRICGCSAERSAAHACCCWQQRLREAAPGGHESRLTEHRQAATPSCCSAGKSDHVKQAGNTDTNVATAKTARETSPVITARPCGSGKQIALWGAEKIQHLPFLYFCATPLTQEHSLVPAPHGALTSRHGDPPDPPPKLTSIA